MAIEGEVVKEYLAKFPKTPSLTLAKKIYRENKEVFKSAEHARNTIRYHRGQYGKRNRKKIAPTFKTSPGKNDPFDAFPVGLKHFNDWTPYKIMGENVLVIADVHIPFHDRESVLIALRHGQACGVDTVLILGDLGDFYSVSWWERDPRLRNFKAEIDMVKDFFKFLRQLFPKAEIVYKIGNHEERYERYLKVKAPDLLGIEIFELANLLDTETHGVQIVGDRRVCKIAGLHLIHGHEFGRAITSPVNPARGLFLKGKEIAMTAHHHQSSNHGAATLADEKITCWSIGCLCDLHPDWKPLNEWNHGFACVERDGKKFYVRNKKIVDGEVFDA